MSGSGDRWLWLWLWLCPGPGGRGCTRGLAYRVSIPGIISRLGPAEFVGQHILAARLPSKQRAAPKAMTTKASQRIRQLPACLRTCAHARAGHVAALARVMPRRYHNKTHAADVLQGMHCLLTKGGLHRRLNEEVG